MPNLTPNLGLNVWLENEVVDFDQINENFEKIDGLVVCTESGTTTAGYSGGVSGTATWYYRKYSDGTVDMCTKLEFTNIKCNGGSEVPYYSGYSNVYFPLTLSQVFDVQMHLSSNTIGWVANITGRSVIDSVMFRVMAMHYESAETYKQIFINVKGRLAT